MPLYNAAGAAAALGVPHKWLDNLLSHHRINGVVQSTQGVARRLGPGALLTIAVAHTLMRDLGVAAPRALDLAERLAGAEGGSIKVSPILSLSVSLEALRTELAHRLASAIEITPHRPRGRPPGQR